MALTLAEAHRIIEVTMAKAGEMNIKVSVAVVDAGGRLVSFSRQDGASWASAYGCQGKAMAAVATGRPSADSDPNSPTMKGIAAAEGGHMFPGARGAVPILRNGLIDGACGVGGGTAEQDEECARAGIGVLG